ncbi:hypothetical protein [Bradyrhizobium sp.]|uniref:hypothetical protein n=1 Tax=Bradyrhizobium sp. TaxID=376 RepID=UPI003C521BC8
MLWFLFVLFFAEALLHVALPAWRRDATPSRQGPDDRKKQFDDPVYKRNVKTLIERSRQFEIERNRKFETKP